MNRQNARELKRILDSGDVRASLKSFLEKQNALSKHVKKPMRIEREEKEKQKRLGRKEETAAIREACMTRAIGCCEVFECIGSADEMDHWLGGNGRRRQRQSIETCWMLCQLHHQARTRARPSAVYWNERFAIHCKTHGYPFTPHIEHHPLPSKRSP